jgi:hypothetical protein
MHPVALRRHPGLFPPPLFLLHSPVASVLADFHAQPFHIAQMRQRFADQAQSDLTSTYSDSAMAQDPANPTLLADEIAAEVDFFKKIKFKYREQEAKESFLKLILADHPEQIDQAENEAVGACPKLSPPT